jgi:hydroxymethylbilane synthase
VITTSPLRIGTRKSALAIVQARQVIAAMDMGINYELLPIISSGDRIEGPLHSCGGKSLFTKELDTALLQGEVDLVVHSMKDVETPLPEGLELAAVPLRLDPRDVLITNPNIEIENSDTPITIGTSSLRRGHQLRFRHPHISILPCRGNIQNRLQKYANGEFDGIILAVAGLMRMGLFNENRIDSIMADVQILDANSYVPAPGQGALAIVKRKDDVRFDTVLQKVNCPNSFLAVQIERMITDALNLSCHDAVGVHALIEGALFSVHIILFTPQGQIEKKANGLLKNRDKIIPAFIEEIQQLRV